MVFLFLMWKHKSFQRKLKCKPERLFWEFKGLFYPTWLAQSRFSLRLCNPHDEPINSTVPPTLHQRTFDKHHQQSCSVSLNARPAFTSVPPALYVCLSFLLLFFFHEDLCDEQWCELGLGWPTPCFLVYSFSPPLTHSLFPLTLFVFAVFSCSASARPLLYTPPPPWNQLLGNQLQRLPER